MNEQMKSTEDIGNEIQQRLDFSFLKSLSYEEALELNKVRGQIVLSVKAALDLERQAREKAEAEVERLKAPHSGLCSAHQEPQEDCSLCQIKVCLIPFKELSSLRADLKLAVSKLRKVEYLINIVSSRYLMDGDDISSKIAKDLRVEISEYLATLTTNQSEEGR